MCGIVTWRNHRGTLHLKERYITTGSLKNRKEARRLIAHQRYVVWHRNYGQCLCFFNIILKYFINAREVPPYFIAARNVPPCLGVTGTAEGGTAIFYYYGKITAIFRSTGNRRNRYRHISQYREPPKSVPPYFVTARKLPPYFAVPGTAEIGTAIFRSTGNRKKNTAKLKNCTICFRRKKRYRGIPWFFEQLPRTNIFLWGSPPPFLTYLPH